MFRRKAQPLVLKVFLSSRDLYMGKTLKILLNKRVDCPQCTAGYESHEVHVPAGTRSGEDLVIQDGYNEYQNAEASDLVLKIIEVPTPGFERNGLNLVYWMAVTLREVGRS